MKFVPTRIPKSVQLVDLKYKQNYRLQFFHDLIGMACEKVFFLVLQQFSITLKDGVVYVVCNGTNSVIAYVSSILYRPMTHATISNN